jgi:hypothetical protein
VRQNTVPITEANWNASGAVVGSVPAPAAPTSYQSMQISGLAPNTTYYFAMKVRDEAGDHWSRLSNVVQAHTLSGGGGLAARRSGPGEASAGGAAPLALELERSAEAAALIGSSQALAAEVARAGEALAWLVYRLGADETAGVAAGAGGAQVVMQLREGSAWAGRAQGSMGAADSLLSLHVPAADRARFVFLGDHRLVLASEGAQGLEIQSADHNRLGTMIEDLAPAAGEFEIDAADSLALTYAPAAGETSPTAGFLTLRRVGTRTASTARQPQGPQMPRAFALAQNRPNPFAATTRIHFDLPRDEHVRLEVFDLFGRRVAVLADHRFPAGFHAVDWDRQGFAGGRVQPGVYVYRMQAGAFRAQRKLVLLP